jgi:hypothetical protein
MKEATRRGVEPLPYRIPLMLEVGFIIETSLFSLTAFLILKPGRKLLSPFL